MSGSKLDEPGSRERIPAAESITALRICSCLIIFRMPASKIRVVLESQNDDSFKVAVYGIDFRDFVAIWLGIGAGSRGRVHNFVACFLSEAR